jgi:hypothetical protein
VDGEYKVISIRPVVRADIVSDCTHDLGRWIGILGGKLGVHVALLSDRKSGPVVGRLVIQSGEDYIEVVERSADVMYGVPKNGSGVLRERLQNSLGVEFICIGPKSVSLTLGKELAEEGFEFRNMLIGTREFEERSAKVIRSAMPDDWYPNKERLGCRIAHLKTRFVTCCG